MAILYKEDLEKVDRYATSALENEYEETNKIITYIENFNSGSLEILTGRVWDNERNRMMKYIPVLKKRQVIARELLQTVKSANKIMSDYIAKFPWNSLAMIPNIGLSKNKNIEMIDDSWGIELSSALELARNNCSSITDNPDDTDIQKRGKSQTRYYYNSIIHACQTVIDYLAQLQPTANEAYSKYEGIISKINSLKLLNRELNEDLFPSLASNTVSEANTPIHSGSGSTSPMVSPNNPSTNNEPTNPIQPGISTTPVDATPIDSVPVDSTPVNQVSVEPVTQVVSPSPVLRPTPTVTTQSDESVIGSEPDVEISDEPIVDEVDQPIIVDNPINESPTYVTRNHGNSTLKNVGIGIVGAAALGAAGYGTYKTAKKIKENNSLDDEYSSDDDNDYDKENIEITYGKDDI